MRINKEKKKLYDKVCKFQEERKIGPKVATNHAITLFVSIGFIQVFKSKLS
jgi:hypothetical protein